MAKEKKKDLILMPIVELVEGYGYKVNTVYAANSWMPYDWDKKEYKTKLVYGKKWLRVECDYVVLELE